MENKRKVILFDTSIATLNLGDEIIMNSIEHEMEEYLKNSYCIRMPVHTPLFHGYQNLLSKKIDRFSDVDYKFVCGTNLLYKNMLRPLPGWNITLFNTKLLKNSVLLGVGSGENSKKVTLYTKMLYSKVLSQDYYHSTRDEKTKEMLEGLGYKAINTGCPTVWSLNNQHCATIPKQKAESAVFSLTHYSNLKDIKNDKIMIEILKRNYKKLYFWPQSILDVDYLKSLEDNEDIIIIPPNLKSYEQILKNDVDYIGNRLHGGIFALQHKKRTIIIAIDHRARNMKKSYSLPIIDRNSIEKKLEKIINSYFETKVLGIDYKKINLWKSQFF